MSTHTDGSETMTAVGGQVFGQMPDDISATLRAVYRVHRAASSAEQRAAAARLTNRWTVLALDVGWTASQIAAVVGQHH